MIMSIMNAAAVRHGRKFCCVESMDNPVLMIRFCPCKGRQVLLPWSRFEYANFLPGEDSQRIELVFAHHKVTAIGYGLEPLEKEISQMRIRCLRDLPESHFLTFEPEEPFIKRLEIGLVDGAKNPFQGNMPF